MRAFVIQQPVVCDWSLLAGARGPVGGWRRPGGGWRRPGGAGGGLTTPAGGSDLTPAAGVSNVHSSQAYLALLSQASTDESGQFTTSAAVGFSHRRRQHWDKEPSLLYTGIRRA